MTAEGGASHLEAVKHGGHVFPHYVAERCQLVRAPIGRQPRCIQLGTKLRSTTGQSISASEDFVHSHTHMIAEKESLKQSLGRFNDTNLYEVQQERYALKRGEVWCRPDQLAMPSEILPMI